MNPPGAFFNRAGCVCMADGREEGVLQKYNESLDLSGSQKNATHSAKVSATNNSCCSRCMGGRTSPEKDHAVA